VGALPGFFVLQCQAGPCPRLVTWLQSVSPRSRVCFQRCLPGPNATTHSPALETPTLHSQGLPVPSGRAASRDPGQRTMPRAAPRYGTCAEGRSSRLRGMTWKREGKKATGPSRLLRGAVAVGTGSREPAAKGSPASPCSSR